MRVPKRVPNRSEILGELVQPGRFTVILGHGLAPTPPVENGRNPYRAPKQEGKKLRAPVFQRGVVLSIQTKGDILKDFPFCTEFGAFPPHRERLRIPGR